MTTNEFISLVQRMRDAQKDYFRTRMQSALNTAKDLERRVDEELKVQRNPVIQTDLKLD